MKILLMRPLRLIRELCFLSAWTLITLKRETAFTKRKAKWSLEPNYRIPMLYFDKFMKGAQGTDNMYLLRSPSYEGERDLNTYPKYSPYTIDSLEQMIKFADQCLALPPSGTFNPGNMKNLKPGCQVLKEAATALCLLSRKGWFFLIQIPAVMICLNALNIMKLKMRCFLSLDKPSLKIKKFSASPPVNQHR